MRPQVIGIVALLITAMAFYVFAGDSTTLKAIAFALLGVGCVVLVSLVFLAVGKSEDEAREAERRRAERPPPPPSPPPPGPHAGEAARRSRPRRPRRPS